MLSDISVLNWTPGSDVGSGPLLTFPSGISREQAGLYICQANNRHGVMQVKTVLRVNFLPECVISTMELETGLTMQCRAEGNPRDFSFSWKKNNLTFSDFSQITQNSNFGKISWE